jgi:hypothetical protein
MYMGTLRTANGYIETIGKVQRILYLFLHQLIPPALGTYRNGLGGHDACVRRESIAGKTAAAINDSGALLRRVRAPPLDAVGLCSLKSVPCA